MQSKTPWLAANWAAPPQVIAGTTTRLGGISVSEGLASNNMGLKVGDNPEQVRANRQGLLALIGEQLLDADHSLSLQWLDQVHGVKCLRIDELVPAPEADAMWTDQPAVALAIQSADCVPVVLASDDGQIIGAAHGGWRGLLAGVLAELVQAMPAPPTSLFAWIGPSIGPTYFEVGAEVWSAVNVEYPAAVARHPTDAERRLVNLPLIAQLQLQNCGVLKVQQSGVCTYANPQFYSHRRATHDQGVGGQSGRMATWVCRAR